METYGELEIIPVRVATIKKRSDESTERGRA